MAFDFEIVGYRSFDNWTKIASDEKFLFVIGQNNTGKSNVLNSIAIALNEDLKGKIDPKHDFNGTKNIEVIYKQDSLVEDKEIIRVFQKYNKKSFPHEIYDKNNGGMAYAHRKSIDHVMSVFSHSEIESIISELGNQSNLGYEQNANVLMSSIQRQNRKKYGTVYVPTMRHLTNPGHAIPSFAPRLVPGETVVFPNLINLLNQLKNPSDDRGISKQRFNQIENFLQYCLEKKEILITLSYDIKEIYIDIDGNDREIRALGAGIEQLLIIAVAALGFDEKKIILIEEPELNLHPRIQKRMIQFFKENTGNQFVISTHSAAILDTAEGSIFHVSHDGLASKINKLEISHHIFDAVSDLGYRASDLVQSNCIIWVEGPSDRIYLNAWIFINDQELVEGIDYSILFYGGRILSHFSVDEDTEANDFVNVLGINRNAAILIDSDREAETDQINSTKLRIAGEFGDGDRLCWITDGREIENYIPAEKIDNLITIVPNLNEKRGKFDKIYDKKLDKIRLAHAVVDGLDAIPDQFDLRARVEDLIKFIRKANQK